MRNMINRTIEVVGGRRYKTYRIFEKRIGSGATPHLDAPAWGNP